MSAGLAQQVAGLIGTDAARAAQLQEQIGPQWELIEGAKGERPGCVSALGGQPGRAGQRRQEDDAAGAVKGAADVSAAMRRYLEGIFGMSRRGSRLVLVAVAVVAVAVVAVVAVGQAVPAWAAGSAVSKVEAVRQLGEVRDSIDQTLTLIKQGRAEEALAQARAGYLDHFEFVEVPLRLVAPDLTADAETKFAEVRGLISSGAPIEKVRDRIVELRRLIDDTERRLTDTGAGAPAVVAGQSFLIIFREGLEAVLLLTALLGYLEAAKATQYRKPIVWGMGLAVVATGITFLLLRAILAALPVGREVLEAVTAIAAVAVLVYISFWLITRLEHRRWIEFVRSRVWNAVSVGSTAALVLVGFTALYREGFETALLYQALVEFGQGLERWIVAGLALGVVVLAVVAYGIFRLGRQLPVRTFLVAAVVLLMATSVAFLGNAVRSLQTADLVGLTPLAGWPRTPIFLAQALGYWPSVQTIVAQAGLAAVYGVGALYLFVVHPRRERAAQSTPAPKAPGR